MEGGGYVDSQSAGRASVTRGKGVRIAASLGGGGKLKSSVRGEAGAAFGKREEMWAGRKAKHRLATNQKKGPLAYEKKERNDQSFV